MWPHKCNTNQNKGHDVPVCSALFNSSFNLVISGDDSSSVYVWKVDDGERVSRFQHAHGTSKITSMAFDAPQRRLLTAANDGTVRMWNFNNGQLLKEFQHTGDMQEVTQVLYVSDLGRNNGMKVWHGCRVWGDTMHEVTQGLRVSDLGRNRLSD